LALISFTCDANAAGKPDLHSCQKSAGKNGELVHALGIALYYGHPSEHAILKPDNDDDDEIRRPSFWAMGPSEYDYWYVCIYDRTDYYTHAFKLPKKDYSICTNIRHGKFWDKLECK